MTDTKGELVFVRMEIAVLLTDRKDKKMPVIKICDCCTHIKKL